MAFTERIKIIVDWAGDGASRGVKSLKTDIDAADGSVGKMKAGFGAAGDFMKSHALGLAAVAGPALAGALFKAADAAAKLGIEAGAMGDKLGISSEDASRWIEVAGDVGISSETVEATMLKMNMAIGKSPGLFKAANIEIAKTKDGNTDVAATYANVLDRLKATTDAGERQALGAKLLGKSWADVAELLNGDVRAALDSVSDAKVIDDEEVDQAREYREAMDGLKDKFEELSITAGQSLVPALTTTLGLLTKIIDLGGMIGEGFNDTIGSDLADDAIAAHRATQELENRLTDASAAASSFEARAAGLSGAVGDLGTSTDAVHGSLDTSTQAMLDNAAAADEAAKRTKALDDNVKSLTDTVNSAISSDFAYQSAINATEDAAKAYYDSLVALNKAQGPDQAAAVEEASRQQQGLLETYVAQSLAAVDLWTKQSELAGVTLSAADSARIQRDELEKVRTTLDPASTLYASLTGYIGQLNAIPGVVTTAFDADTTEAMRKAAALARAYALAKGAIDEVGGVIVTSADAADRRSGQSIPQGATGGIVTRPTLALIGEAGPEAVVPLNRTPGSSALGTMGGDTYNIILPSGSVIMSERQTLEWIVEGIHRIDRRGGGTGLVNAS